MSDEKWRESDRILIYIFLICGFVGYVQVEMSISLGKMDIRVRVLARLAGFELGE